MPERALKPGGSTLIQGADVARSSSDPAPGKQTRTESMGVAPKPKQLVPDTSQPPPGTTIVVPDADHPSRRDIDGDQVIQTGQTTEPGQAAPPGRKPWQSLAEVTESVNVQDGSGDTLHIDITYRIESRPAEVSEVPDMWVHTERKALLTIGSGEHAGATIVGQARIQLAPGEARDPKAAIARASVGADHWAQVYLAEAKQYVDLHGAGGRPSLVADAADNDVLAYDDPLRMLVGLKNILKQQHVAGHGDETGKMHAQAQQLLAVARRGRAILEQEIASIASYHDPQPGWVAPVRFLIGDIEAWLAANQRAGRDDTEDARQLRAAHGELQQLLAQVERTQPPKRNQTADALDAPVRFLDRTGEGIGEFVAMVVDLNVLTMDALGARTGIGTSDYHPISNYGKAVDASNASTTTALVTLVNGFADEWSDAIERAKHGDYRSLTDTSIDTLMMIDGARTGGIVAIEKAELLTAKLGSVAQSARMLAAALPATAGDVAALAGRIPAHASDIAAAMADGADAFVARLRAGGMQMSTANGGGGSGPSLGGLSGDTLVEAAQAAKEAFKETRAAQEAAKQGAPEHGQNTSANTDPTHPASSSEVTAPHTAVEKGEEEAQQATRSAAGNAETNATKKYIFEETERAAVEKMTRDAALEAARKAYRDAIAGGEPPAQANTAANKAAKNAAENVAKAEAVRTAKEAAQRGGTFDMQRLDSNAQSQLEDFDAGKTGGEAKRLARELNGMSDKEFLAKMAGEPCSMKTVNIDGPPPQAMRVYEYPDGTVVRYKPLGDTKRSGPTYSVEVKKDPSAPDLGKDDAAFKVNSSGNAVPKRPAEIKNPYPKGSVQADAFREEVMSAGHKALRGDHG